MKNAKRAINWSTSAFNTCGDLGQSQGAKALALRSVKQETPTTAIRPQLLELSWNHLGISTATFR
jgi:hypothetical protein